MYRTKIGQGTLASTNRLLAAQGLLLRVLRAPQPDRPTNQSLQRGTRETARVPLNATVPSS
jgi:hypothetical protein